MAMVLGLGFLVGAIMALTGAGGGILAVPMLVFGLQLGVAEAGPVGLLAVGIAAFLGALLGLKKGIVRYRAALLMASMGIILSPVGVWSAKQLDGQWLAILFACVLLVVGYRTFRQANDSEPAHGHDDGNTLPCVRSPDNDRFIWTTRCARALGLSGAMAGLLSGLLGVGGGFVMVPSLRRYSDLSAESIIATSLAVTALISASSVIFSASTGAMNWAIAMPFAGGAVAGMTGGRFIIRYMAPSHLQKSFAVVTVIVAIGMLVKAVV